MAYSPASPQGILSYLTGTLGYTPPQAAAIVGNMEQESGFNPNALNRQEGAYGLLQWRGPRLDALKQFAAANGSDPSDWRTQLDFTRAEMSGAEGKSAAPFLSANTVPAANAALHGYIRYGDNSESRRLQNAQNFLPQQYAAVNSAPLIPGTQAPALPPPITIGGPPVSGPQRPLPAVPQQAQQQGLPGMGGSMPPQIDQPLPQAPPLPPNPILQMAAYRQPPNTRALQQLLQNSAPVFRGLIS